MIVVDEKRNSQRFSAALTLVLKRYAVQIRRRPALALPALFLPAVGDLLVFYVPPLIVARLLRAFAGAKQLSGRDFVPYVLAFTGVWLAGEVVWRVAAPAIARAEIRGIESLYLEAMDELLSKDLAFFHENYAGSLTKRALGYARRFEDVFDVLCFQVLPNLLPLAFVSVVLWEYSPLLVLVLVGMMTVTCALVVPRIRRRRQLVDIREAASNVLAGHRHRHPGRQFQILLRAAAPVRKVFAQDRGGNESRTCRPVGRRQNNAHEAAVAVRRRGKRRHFFGRPAD